MLSVLAVAAPILLATALAPGSSREIDNVAAFTRPYGVVRYFYPSDAAADLDWSRFAVHGVSRVRAARSAAELEAILEQLVAPLGPGIEIGARLSPAPAPGGEREPLVAWRYLGPGFGTAGGAYRAKRTHRSAPGPTDAFATLMQTVPAEALRGKAIRLRGQVRATTGDATGGAALWLRVDRANQAMGLFDNMGNRLVRDAEWRPYAIEGTVAADAEVVAFGVMAVGGVTADFDAVELAVKDATGDWTPVPVEDPGFEGAAGDEKGPWFRTGTSPAAVSRSADRAPQGGQFLRFAPPPVGAADVEVFPEGAPTPGAHADLDLGAGIRARVPLALTDAQARPDPVRKDGLDALRTALSAVGGPSEAPDVDQRLGDVVVAWSVFRHFYPYWTEAGVDWESRLAPQLEAARAADTRSSHRDTLKGLKGASAKLGIDTGAGPREVTVTYGATPPPPKRPGPVAELASGVWYVDLTRAKMAEVAPKLEALAAARGVVFDVRGYPTDAGFGVLPHLLAAGETDRWMHVAKIVGPFYETAGWQDIGWDLKPATPGIKGKVVFLTDGGAISYAESVMGYVADRKLGTIVGETTAGTNGNIASFLTPGGFTVGFTGMRVTRHDGRSPHHLVGVAADVPVAPTLAALRAGRDEVLEAGLAIVTSARGR